MTVTPDAPDLRQAAIDAHVADAAKRIRLEAAFQMQRITPGGGSDVYFQQQVQAATYNLEDRLQRFIADVFGSLAEGLFIAEDTDGRPAVYDSTLGGVSVIGPNVVTERLWELLAAVIPPGRDHAQEDGS